MAADLKNTSVSHTFPLATFTAQQCRIWYEDDKSLKGIKNIHIYISTQLHNDQ
jgi:hypothetical protein